MDRFNRQRLLVLPLMEENKMISLKPPICSQKTCSQHFTPLEVTGSYLKSAGLLSVGFKRQNFTQG